MTFFPPKCMALTYSTNIPYPKADVDNPIKKMNLSEKMIVKAEMVSCRLNRSVP